MSALTGTIQRLAFDLTSREPVVDSSTGEEIRLWQAGRTLFQCGLFKDNPSEDSIVDTIANLVSATLIVRRTNAQGAALISKTVTTFSLPTFEEWTEEDGEHFTIPLSEVETNQTLPHNGVLKVYYTVQVTTTSGSYVAGQGYGEIVNVGLSAGLPTIPPTGPYVFNGNVTIPNLTVTGTIVAAGGITGNIAASSIQFLDYVDATWHGVDITGATDSTSELNAALADAELKGVDLYIPRGLITFSQTLEITSSVTIRGDGGEGPTTSAPGTILKWIGASNGVMITSTDVERGGGLQNLSVDANGLAVDAIIIDGSAYGTYKNLRIFGFTTGTGLTVTATNNPAKKNRFETILINGDSAGKALLWLTWGGIGDDATLNTFRNMWLTNTSGDRPGIVLGCCDGNYFYDTYITTAEISSGVFSPGVLVDPDENNAEGTLGVSRPNANVFYNLLAGRGGWVQPASAVNLISPNFIYGYGKLNQEPDPDDGGAPETLIWTDEYGRFNNLNALSTQLGTGISSGGGITAINDVIIRNPFSTSFQGFSIISSHYNIGAESAAFALGDVAAEGNITGSTIPKENTGSFYFQNLTAVAFSVNNFAPFLFWTGGDVQAQITTAGLDARVLVQDNVTNITTFQNGWSNYGTGVQTASFYKTRDGIARFQGSIKLGAVGNAVILFTIPEEITPTASRIFRVNNSGTTTSEVQVQADGTVRLYHAGAPNAYLALDQISYRVY